MKKIICLVFILVACNYHLALELEELLNVTTSLQAGEEREEAEVLSSKVSLESALKDFDGTVDLDTTDEQTRVDTLIRALKRLPDEELALYGLGQSQLDGHVTPGSREAATLFAAWQERQKELKKAIDSMLKPAEYMQELVEFIVSTTKVPPGSGKFASKMDALQQLEGLVEDIDNARDFHTTGGFTTLSVSVFGSSGDNYTAGERGVVALALGNAVKNDYDSQLWVLENDAICLHGLLEMLGSGKSDDLERRRALYALSSATRGNPDIQEALVAMTAAPKPGAGTAETSETNRDNLLAAVLHDLTRDFIADSSGKALATSGPAPSLELIRKIYAFVSDMLHEHQYLQEQIRNPQDLNLGEVQIGVGGNSEGMSEAAMASHLMNQLHAIRLIGGSFCTPEWRMTMLKSMKHIGQVFIQAPVGEEDEHKRKRSLLHSLKEKFRGSDPSSSSSSGEVSMVAARAGLENVLRAFLYTSTACEQKVKSYSTTRGDPQGPGSLAADAKDTLRGAMAWVTERAGDASGDLGEVVQSALELFE